MTRDAKSVFIEKETEEFHKDEQMYKCMEMTSETKTEGGKRIG